MLFFWRKRNAGFEWHKYVRTTIKLRRDARREKADMLKRQAADGVKAAGAVAGEAARVSARKLGAGSRIAASVAGSWLGQLIARSAAGLGWLLATTTAQVKVGFGLPQRLARLEPRARMAAIGGLVVLGIGIVSAAAGLAGLNLQRFAGGPSLPFRSAKAIEGRASVLGADTLRVGTTVIKLADIEAPEKDQRCLRAGNRRWRCGEAALAALGRLANGRTLKCDVRGTDTSGVATAICFDKETDINAALVKGGHVFALTGLMSRYGSLEAEARNAKSGLWAGEAERPAVYRARMWEEAKKRAPDGCPIKGHVTGSSRGYVMPWAADYDRVRVNTQRGGRWFCSEEDAVAAGWKIKLASGI